MPGIIAHIVYTQKFLDQNKLEDQNSAYLIGSLIPDIRYLGVLTREVTHIELDYQALEKVTQLVLGDENIDSFRRGFLFHNFLDHWWADKYSLSNEDWFKGMALKMYQDNQFFSKIIDLENLRNQLNIASTIYSLKGVQQTEFNRWIDFLLEGLKTEPAISRQLALMKSYKLLSEDKYQLLEEALRKISDSDKNTFSATLNQLPAQNLPEILIL